MPGKYYIHCAVVPESECASELGTKRWRVGKRRVFSAGKGWRRTGTHDRIRPTAATSNAGWPFFALPGFLQRERAWHPAIDWASADAVPNGRNMTAEKPALPHLTSSRRHRAGIGRQGRFGISMRQLDGKGGRSTLIPDGRGRRWRIRHGTAVICQGSVGAKDQQP